MRKSDIPNGDKVFNRHNQGAAARLDRGFNLDEVRRFAIQEPVKLNLAQLR